MAQTAQPNVRQLRQSLLDLSALQKELRQSLADYRARTGAAIGTIAREAGMPWNSLNRFAEGNIVLSSGRGLAGLCRILDAVDLGERIARTAASVGDRYLGMAICSREVIVAAFDLIEYQRDRADIYSTREFALAFGRDAATVEGVLSGSKEALAALSDEQTRDRITSALLEGLDECLAAAKQRLETARLEAAAKLTSLVEPLALRTGGKTKVAALLGSHRTTLHYAMAGRASLDQTEKLIAEAQKLAARMGAPTETKPSEVTATGPPVRVAAEPAIPAALAALAGVTTEEGIDYVLTEASFRAIAKVPLVALRDALIAYIKGLRLLLNVASQLTDEIARQSLQEDVARELRELDKAVQLFGFNYPSELLPLYDNERALQIGSSKRKGRPT